MKEERTTIKVRYYYKPTTTFHFTDEKAAHRFYTELLSTAPERGVVHVEVDEPKKKG